jgi:hypothetical protein
VNEDSVITAFVTDKAPSIAEVRRLATEGHIRPSWAFSIINQIESEQRQEFSDARAEARYERAEAREAEQRAEAETGYEVATRAELLRSGVTAGVSDESLKRELDSGAFGSGKKAVAHYQSLNIALRQGREVAQRSPEAAAANARWDGLKASRRGDGNLLRASRAADGGRAITPEAHAAGAALIRKRIREGADPAEAYQEAVHKYGNVKAPEQRQQRIRELRARQGR